MPNQSARPINSIDARAKATRALSWAIKNLRSTAELIAPFLFRAFVSYASGVKQQSPAMIPVARKTCAFDTMAGDKQNFSEQNSREDRQII